MTLNISERFLKEVLLKVEFRSVPILSGENGDPSDFEVLLFRNFQNFYLMMKNLQMLTCIRN